MEENEEKKVKVLIVRKCFIAGQLADPGETKSLSKMDAAILCSGAVPKALPDGSDEAKEWVAADKKAAAAAKAAAK